MAMIFARRMSRVRPSAIRELLAHGADPDLISFGGGYPDQRLFPLDDLRAVLDDLLRPERSQVLQYATSEGLPALRALIAERMRAGGTPTSADDVLVLSGGQQGLDLVAKLLVDPGDTIIVEDPTFLGALIAFAPLEPSYATVRMDEQGMDVERLAEVLRANPDAKFIYTVPDFHNPTGVTMSIERRRRLIELANEYDVLVLEDTPYRELCFEGVQAPTLASLDTEGRVVHLSSFSKILAPGLRLGWLTASPEIRERLGLLKLAADTQSGTLAMAATAAYLKGFDIDAHVQRLRDVYRAKRDLMIRTIDETFPDTVARTYPTGGLFTWLTFPEGFDSARFMAEVAVPEAKVAYVPGATFFAVDPRPNHARVNFSSVPEEQIVAGITRLGEALHRAVAEIRLVDADFATLTSQKEPVA
ncbi:aminotransferase-like domain-containing protein [Microbacterium sp. CPCC 204701]|uniref:aminotransferase-like domain-containing protein n=1 Tax=Microbacterium sp. CPCC 204701 TaxID=2493084 RepID=UPI0013E32C4E|nr:PLP-dependent aminotransferase family protein [Microbacterium sp. CPCC 204701]